MDFVFLIAVGLAAGTLGSMLGLGGGFLIVPVLLLVRNMEEHIATGTATAVIVPAMIVAVSIRGNQGEVDWRVAALIAVGAVIGAVLGATVAPKIEGVWLRRMFAGVLVVLAGILAFKD